MPAGIPCAQTESARHSPLHEPPPDDPPGRDVRSGLAGQRSRRRCGTRYRGVHHLRRPGAPIRIRPERLDQRQDVPRAGQRARPDLRNARRRTRFHRPQAADPQGPQGHPGVHDADRRGVLLPAGAQRTALSLRARHIEGFIMRARTYNQSHIARQHDGRRRGSIYWTWSYPWESQRDPAGIYNRFSTITEVRSVAWPAYETVEYAEANFLQGIAGTLELFHRSTLSFQELAEETTGHPVAVFQRIDQAGYRQ